MMRYLSAQKEERVTASAKLGGPVPVDLNSDQEAWEKKIEGALYVATILTYAQGFALLAEASKAYNYELNLAGVARIWRGGCIIRAALLNPIMDSFEKLPDLPNLALSPALATVLAEHREDLAELLAFASAQGIALPGMAAALNYYDAFRSARLPANLIQAQRDFFGAHTYERSDQPGIFHTQWGE